MPRATFLMSVYNAAPYLQECIDSILQQSIPDFECWIIDDASDDGSREIIEKQSDPRIKKFYNAVNLGIAASVNQYLHKIESEYIFRMDADDICFPNRLEKQLKLMDANPKVDLSGGALQYFGTNDYTWFPAEQNKAIESRLFFNCAIPNPTLVIRGSFLRKHRLYYSAEFTRPPMEDYAFLIDSIGLTEFANIPDILVKHREHEKNQSILHLAEKEESMIRIYEKLFLKLEIPVTPSQLQLHYQLSYNLPDFNTFSISDFIDWSKYLLEERTNDVELKRTLRYYLFKLFKHLKPKPLTALQLMLYLYSL